MIQEGRKPGRLRRPFVIGGGLIGAAVCLWYLYRSGSGTVLMPDPIWLRFVNVALIMFCAIYLANLLRRLLERGRK